MANKKKIFDRLDNLNIPNSSKNEIFNLIEDVEKDIEKSGETGGEIPEIIDKEIYYNDGSNEVVPIKHPDLSTQPSILPYKFMGQYVYEQLIPASGDDTYLDVINLGTYNPIVLSVVAIQEDGYSGNDARCMIEGNRIRFFMANSPISSLLYYRIVYTSMPEEGGDYYYNNNIAIASGIILKFSTSAPPISSCYIYNGDKYIYGVAVAEGLYFNIPSDYNGDFTAILISFEDSSYKLKKAVYSSSNGKRGELNVESTGIYIDDIIHEAKNEVIIITASE